MRLQKKFVLLTVPVLLATIPIVTSTAEAGPFQNLGFELPVSGTFGNASIPFWDANAPVAPPDTGGCLAPGCIGIYDAQSLIGLPTLVGNQTLLLQAPVLDQITFDPLPAIVSQVGDVPSNASQIRLVAKIFPTFIPNLPGEESVVGVSANAVDVDLFVVERTAEMTLLAGDLSAFAGQTVQLEISADALGLEEIFVGIDGIHFVPEPTSLITFVVGVIIVLYSGRVAVWQNIH